MESNRHICKEPLRCCILNNIGRDNIKPLKHKLNTKPEIASDWGEFFHQFSWLGNNTSFNMFPKPGMTKWTSHSYQILPHNKFHVKMSLLTAAHFIVVH